MRLILVAFVVLVCLVVIYLAAPVSAQEPTPSCAPQAQMQAMLKAKFKEKPAGIGISGDGNTLIHLYLSDTGSWTITATDAQGKSCVRAGGKDWLDVAKMGIDT